MAHVRAAAQKHGIRGMARNMGDGSVEIFALGDQGILFDTLGLKKLLDLQVVLFEAERDCGILN